MSLAHKNHRPNLINPCFNNVPKSATLAINEKSKALIEQGREITRLGLGQSPFPVPEIVVEELRKNAEVKDYLQVQGLLPLRQAIAEFVKRTEMVEVDAERIIIGPGSKELLFGLQMVLDCDLILPAPSWVSYEPQARILNHNCYWIPCSKENDWKISAQDLEKHCQNHKDTTQLLILNSPNNPSGAAFTEDELKQLAKVAEKHQIIVLSDEIYSELHYQGTHQSIARYYPQGTIISNGISKWCGAGGWRLGAFAFPAELDTVLQAMVILASESFTSVSAPIQFAAIKAFEPGESMNQYIIATRSIMKSIGEHLAQTLNAIDIDAVKPYGGFYLIADFSHYRTNLLAKGITSSAQLAEKLLLDTGIAGLPGSDFGVTQKELVLRFAFVDFDGKQLLQRVLDSGESVLNDQTPELEKLFAVPGKIKNWLG